jgi:hypothetical protein
MPGFVLRELSSRLIWVSSKTIKIRYIEDHVTIYNADCARYVTLAPVKDTKCEKWLRHNMTNHMVRQGESRGGWKKKGRFHESSWPAVVGDHQIVGARRDQIRPLSHRWLALGRALWGIRR